jgi:hypothetical protein
MLTGNVDSRGQVAAGAGTEDDGDSARGGRLPGQVKGLASGDTVVVAVGEAVAVGKSQQGRGHKGNEGLSRETHLVCWCVKKGVCGKDGMQAEGSSDCCRKEVKKRE